MPPPPDPNARHPVPENRTGAALLIIDMINELDFGHAPDLIQWLDGVVAAIERVREQARAAGVPIIYVNDNCDLWHSDRERLIAEIRANSPRPDLIDRLAPRPEDYFVIKARFSGFYATNLPVLLPRLGATRLILTGVATDICVLFTAADAYMREYELWVPGDATACHDDQRRDWALDILNRSMHAETRPIRDLAVSDWLDRQGAA